MADEINDRGNLKWSSTFIMPEHAKLLEEWYESDNDVDKPILSDHQLEEMGCTIQQAMEYKQLVSVSYYENKRILNIKGIILGVGAGKMELEDEEGREYLETSNIVGVDLSEG